MLKDARRLAAQRGVSISKLLAEELDRLVSLDAAYEKAKAKALADLNAPLHLGGAKITNREALHERKSLR